ncbi:response regulator [Dyadobacter flavalbus]|uniref:histidine kinase n=1 Tax=Dyadobacter flavalbus TaxID=2579942 RepID=A0A5M8QKK1_9BACT|nr:response regulator [Dyadobacter flavalbus]
MSALRKLHFLKSVTGKVLLGFFLTSLALGLSWFISKRTFEDMLNKVEALSTPNDQLRLVNQIFKNILQLDHLQNARTLKNEDRDKQVLAQSKELLLLLDSLSAMSFDTPAQIVRIDSMRSILEQREKIYSKYIKVRSKLVSNKALSDEVKSISGLITTQLKPESTVVKTEKKTTTTTVYTELPDTSTYREEKKGFLNRVFSGKKNKKNQVAEAPKTYQKQEINVEVDTLKVAQEDSTIEKVGEAVHAIEKSQKIRTTHFVDREQELAIAGNTLVRQLLKVMQGVESEVLKDSNIQTRISKNLVAKSIDGLEWVMLGFFLLTALLAYLIFTDIARSNEYRSQLEEAKEEAEYHSLAKQRFLSNMSHEIRTPLQSIIGYTEALKNSKKPQRQDLEILHSASEHLLYLVNEVLDYSRIISDRFTFEERTFAITPFLNEVIQMLRPTAVSKGLTLKLENNLPPQLYLSGDPFRLRQILYNLLNNAIKFTNSGDVTLRVNGFESEKEYSIEYQISDTGIGLSEEQLQRVFNQFEQADPSISRKYGGTGLGLSIVKALVEGMNGSIKVKSTPNKGTTFFVTTLIKKAETTEIAPDESDQKEYQVTGKVWLVDDDAFILKWCSSVLEMNGIPHTSFSSAEEVLSRPWDNQVKFVLTDMRMSGMNGAELCKRLRRNAAPDVKFFVLTAQAMPEERQDLLNMGFDGFLMKPFHSNELLELLELFSETPQKQENMNAHDFDLSTLNEMTFGDEALLREILHQFVMDCRKDVDSLFLLIDDGDFEKVPELIHRMAGRTGQIGAKELSAQFRNLEVALREDAAQVSAEEITQVLEYAESIIEQVEEIAPAHSI